jgi:hypothetical protein
MLLRKRQDLPPTAGRADYTSSSPAPGLSAREAHSPSQLSLEIDEITASPWIGLHYRHEFLLHHRHEMLETTPTQRSALLNRLNQGGNDVPANSNQYQPGDR